MISPERSHELLRAYTATRCASAFRELVAGWTGMVYATVLRVARGRESLAEDIAQTVFSRLATAPEKVKDARALGAWLHAAATGLTLDALRLEARRRRWEEASHHLHLQHTTMTPPPPATDAGDGARELELMPEIDGALSKLPPQDSQLLLMRFWQKQDWRSIGQTFGLSDDAAQKRMSRALDRLRRILARRGITSTAGVLSAVLAGTVPRDLPAATVFKILSAATQASTAASAALTTTTTTVAMTTKTKVAIAAAIAIAAAVPMVYQQQRIAEQQEEIQALQQQTQPGRSAPAAASALKKTPVAVIAEDRRTADAVPAHVQPSPGDAGPESRGEGGPPDLDAMHRGKLKEKLAVLRTRLTLAPEQETQIAKALEYGQLRFKIDPPNVIPIKPTADDIRKMEDGVLAVLTADQQKEYESFRADEKANALEAVANRELSRLQSMTTLSQEQKDQAFAAFSEIAARESSLPVLDPDKEAAAIREAEKARWAARQEALSTILTPEQMAVYQQAGNPFRRGTGG